MACLSCQKVPKAKHARTLDYPAIRAPHNLSGSFFGLGPTPTNLNPPKKKKKSRTVVRIKRVPIALAGWGAAEWGCVSGFGKFGGFWSAAYGKGGKDSVCRTLVLPHVCLTILCTQCRSLPPGAKVMTQIASCQAIHILFDALMLIIGLLGLGRDHRSRGRYLGR